MTLLQWYAGLAMQTFITRLHGTSDTAEYTAQKAFEFARAMIAYQPNITHTETA